MERFNSAKWIKAFKANAILEKDESIKLDDLLHTDKTGEENALAIEKDKKGRDVYAVGLTEAPIQRSKVDYSTMNLKSNIDVKWTSTDDMEDDLRQWLEAIFASSGSQLTREVGLMLKQIGVAAIKDGTTGGEDRPAGAASKFD